MTAGESKRGKRGQNEGSIVQRKDGLYMARLTIPAADSPTGKAQRKTFYGSTAAEARAKLREAQRKLEDDLPVTTNRVLLKTYLKQWLEESVRPSVAPRTYDSYASLIKNHIEPAIGSHALGRLTADHVQRMMNAQLKSGLSPRTVQYTQAVLRKALSQAMKRGKVSRNVATLVDPPKSVHHDPTFLTPEDAQRLLDTVKEDRLQALYTVALSIGLRQGEALGLSWNDIDLVTGRVTVRRQLQRLAKPTPAESVPDEKKPKLTALVLSEPKTAASRRTIPLPRLAVDQLIAHRAMQDVERQAFGERWTKWGGYGGLVFCTPLGTPVEATNLTRQFKAHLKTAGIPETLRWHDLRHSCATLMLAAGVNSRVVMETLGHSQISMTMNVYAHALPDAKQDAADRMDRLLRGDADR